MLKLLVWCLATRRQAWSWFGQGCVPCCQACCSPARQVATSTRATHGPRGSTQLPSYMLFDVALHKSFESSLDALLVIPPAQHHSPLATSRQLRVRAI